MESGQINKQEIKQPEIIQQEIKLVKKGLVYYLIQLIILPFKLIILLIKLLSKKLPLLFEELEKSRISSKKSKRLNRYINMKDIEEEIL